MSTVTVPSTLFDLSNWKLTLPVDGGGGIAGTALEVKKLLGYEHSSYFFDAPDGAMVFRAMAEGATTSGSKYARSELREMNGSSKADWSLAEGGTMTATLKVDAVPTRADGSGGRLVVGQIHGQDDELVRLYWEDGSVHFVNDQAGPKATETTFQFKNAVGAAPSIDLGETFSYKIDAHGDTLSVSIYADGDVYTSVSKIDPVWQSDSFYFKAGTYLGVNETQGSGTGQTSFYGLDFSHKAGGGLGGLTGTLGLPSRAPVQPAGSGVDAAFYLAENRDVALAGGNAAEHYRAFGWREGRDPNAYFDTGDYLARNPDVAKAGVNPLDHYNASGWKEGRDPGSRFDTSGYLAANPDVAVAGINPLDHYLRFGLAEGRAAPFD